MTWLLFATPAAILKSFKFGQRLEFIHFRLILLTCQARRSLHSKRGEKMRIRIQTCVAQWAKIQKKIKKYIFPGFKIIFALFYLGTKKLCSSPTGLIIEGKVGFLIHNMFASDQKRVKVCRQRRWKIFLLILSLGCRFLYFLLNKKTNLRRTINAFACLHTCSSRIRWSMTPQQKVWEKQGES